MNRSLSALCNPGHLGELVGVKRFLCVFAMLALPVEARIGEAKAECDERYGKGLDRKIELNPGLLGEQAPAWKATEYSARGLKIMILFQDDVAVFISYANEPLIKVERHDPSGIHLTGAELRHLRNVNCGDGVTWARHEEEAEGRTPPSMAIWKSSDERNFAGYDRNSKELFVCSAEFWGVIMNYLRKHSGGEGPDGAATRFKGL